MGNRASISILLDHKLHQAGTPLTGRVVLEVRRQFKSKGSLTLHIVGKEKAMRRMKRQVFRVDLALHEFDGKIAKNLYSFPFKIDLPSSLPASTKYPPNQGKSTANGFRIEYKMVVDIENRLQEERPLIISSAPLSGEPVKYMFQPSSHTVKAAGMLDMGTVSIGASITNSHVGRGEKLDLHLACRNDSTVEIQSVNIKLHEELNWGNSREATLTHFHLQDITLPGLDKNRVTRSELRDTRDDPMSRSACYQSIFRDLVSSLNHVPLSIPTSARDTYKGQIVQISHFLEIKLKTSKLVTSPVIRIPIRIGTPAEKTPPPSPSRPLSGSPLSNICNTVQESEPEIHVPGHRNDGAGIPMASAVVVPAGAFNAPLAVADSTVIVLGGNTIVHEESEDSIDQDLCDLQPLPPPQQLADMDGVSLDRLLFEMGQSINDYDILTAKLEDTEWRSLFSGLTPDQFSSVILRVSDEFDQPRIAALLAPYLNRGIFTCEYAAAAVRSSVPWNRSTVAQRLLPFCADIAMGFKVIQDEMSEWDRTVTENDFQAAINSAR